MTVQFASRAERRIASVRGWLNAVVSGPYEPVELARECEARGRELLKIAGDLRRSARITNKSGVAGAVHEPK